MGSRKLVRDLYLSKQSLLVHLLSSQQASSARLRLISPNGCSGYRGFSVFNEFSKKIKGEVNRNSEFQQTVKELKEKAEELKGVKEELKVRLGRHFNGGPELVLANAERSRQQSSCTSMWMACGQRLKLQQRSVIEEVQKSHLKLRQALEVSANMKEKISAAKEEVKETLGKGNQEFSESSGTSANSDADVKNGGGSSGEEKHQKSGPSETAETLFGKFKSHVSTVSPKVSLAFEKLKEAKVVDLAKKGYDIVKDELSSNPSKRKHMQRAASSASPGERSTKTDIVIVPSKQSRWSKKWEAFKEKMQGHPVFKHVSGLSEPVVTKGQELAEDVRERWETSDNPVVHKIQDLNESVFGETAAAMSFKEIRRRDPSFSLPDFVSEVQEVIRPVLNAYIKGDADTLKKYCSPEVIERCKAEHGAYQTMGIFFDNKILHISDVEVRETKMMGTSPIIIVAFQTQQVYCVRNADGSIKEGGKDTIHTVYYAWAMQQVDAEELGEGAIYPIWRLREMQQLGVQALI